MPLNDNAFEWRVTKSGKLLIYRGGDQIMTIAPEKAVRVLARLGNSADEDQQILARVTGQYRIGNEREQKLKRQ